LQGKTGPEFGRHIKLYLFFHGNTFTSTPVTPEIKIKEVLNPNFRAFHGLWRTKSAGLGLSIWVVRKAGKRFIFIRNFEFKLSASMHNTINEFDIISISLTFKQ